MKMELRFQNTKLSSNEDGSMTVSGYVNKTEQESNILGVTKKFKEKISKGAFSRAINKTDTEIDFLAEHKKNLILSSTRNGSLELYEDTEGLFMKATITPTSWGKDYYELIKSGIYRNMSFGFMVIKDRWRSVGTNLYERTIEELELFEISVVKNPAYSQSTIAARGIDLVTDVVIPTNITNKEEKKIMKIITEHRYGRTVEDKIMEVRNEEFTKFDNFLIGKRSADETGNTSTLQTTGQPTEALIPTSVASEVILKMEENAPVFARARKFYSEAGTLKIPRETSTDNAGFVGEGKNVIEIAMSLGEVKLEQKRYGASVSLTNHLIHDSAFGATNYVVNMLSNRVAKLAEKSTLVGKSPDEFRGIVHDAEINNVEIPDIKVTNLNDEKVLDYFADLVNTIHPDYLDGSSFIMQRGYFNIVSRLKDKAGHFYMQNGIINGKLTFTLLGREVIVTNSLTDENPVVFGNIERGYAIMIKKAQNITHIPNDTKNAMAGTQTFICDVYADGAVYNPDALAKLTVIKA